MLRKRSRCPEKVERLCSILCSSPISAITGAKGNSRLPGAQGIGKPARTISTSRPAVLSATVLPPVLGPLMIRVWHSSGRRRSIGTTVGAPALVRSAMTSKGWRASRRASDGSSANSGTMPSRSTVRRAIAWRRSSRARTAWLSASGCRTSRTPAVKRVRIRSSSRSILCARVWTRLLLSRVAAGST